MTTLYELSAAYRALSERLNDADADMPPEVIADTLDGEAGDLEDKVTNTAKVSQNKRAEASREASAEASGKRPVLRHVRRLSFLALPNNTLTRSCGA